MPVFGTSSRSYFGARRPVPMPKSAAAPPAKMPKSAAVLPPTRPSNHYQTTVADAVNSRLAARPPSRHTSHSRSAPRLRRRSFSHGNGIAAPTTACCCRITYLSADSGSSVFLLRVRISYPSSSTLPHHCDSTSPGLLGVDRSSTVSAGSDPCMSGVCGLSVLETHRISRATRTANVMSLFVFCESRGGRKSQPRTGHTRGIL